MLKRIVALFILATLFIVPVLTAAGAPNAFMQVRTLSDAEAYLNQNMPVRSQLQDMVTRLRMYGGMREQNGVLLTGHGGLVKNIDQYQTQESFNSNLHTLLNFTELSHIPTYFMLIPSACVIKQQWLPATAPLFNQKELIDETYRVLAGKATTVDVYPRLFEKSADYVYYYSDTAPTAYGAFLMYGELARRMKFEPYLDTDFEKEHLSHDYRGNLYSSWNFEGVKPDILTAYHAKNQSLAFSVTQNSTEPRRYATLYPAHLAATQDPYNIYLGGSAPRIDIATTGLKEQNSLLFFGDRSSLNLVPFLALHFSSITFIDLSLCERNNLPSIDLADYTQILIGYDIDTFLNTSHPRKISGYVNQTATPQDD